MKTLTIELPDDVYQRAERRATELGTSLTREVAETVKRLSAAPDTEPIGQNENVAGENVNRLLAALDKARNTESVDGFRRDELYDRNVLR